MNRNNKITLKPNFRLTANRLTYIDAALREAREKASSLPEGKEQCYWIGRASALQFTLKILEENQ